MNFSPPGFTFDDFVEVAQKVLQEFDFINPEYTEITEEDSLPWINLESNRVIKPEEALQILEKLQENIIDEVIFNSLNRRQMRIVVNGKFHMTEEDLSFGFDETYAHDFGITIAEMKKEYGLK
jgi:hypothetical protein